MKFVPTRFMLCAVAGVLVAATLLGQAGSTNVPNWTVPPYRASSVSGGLRTMADISDAAIFVAVTTCRVFDTRDPNGAYGGPRLVANVIRNFDIDGGPCTGIPAGAAAYSMNFGAILPDAAGAFITIWPTGAVQPTSSFMNPIFGTVVANAAIIPASGAGSISVFSNVGVHLYGDINGYFMDSGGQLNDNVTLFVAGSDPNEGEITGFNLDTTTTSTTMAGVRGIIASPVNGPAAVLGQNLGDTGANYAVRGQNDSSSADSAGVFGSSNVDDDPVITPAHSSAGVRGEGATFGVLGFAEFGAVRGVLVSSTGATLAAGTIGSSLGTDVGGSAPWSFFGFVGDIGTTFVKSFVEPHATDPTKIIQYISLEGPEAGTYFRGRGHFQRGVARITVPEDFRMVTHPDDLTVQITPIGGMATVGVLRMDLNEIVVQSSRDLEFSYLVQGVRSAFRDRTPIRTSSLFVPERADSKLPDIFPSELKQRLIRNGTINGDGTVNMETARRLGWDRIWNERAGRPAPRPE